MPSPLKGKPRKEYPANVVRFAQRLYEENGYTIRELLTSLKRRGYAPTEETVKRWVDPDYRLAVNEAKRSLAGPPRSRTRPWKFRLNRMHELREQVGLSATATARLMSHDFGLSLSRSQVEDLLAGRVKKTKTVKRLLHPQGAQS